MNQIIWKYVLVRLSSRRTARYGVFNCARSEMDIPESVRAAIAVLL